MEYPDSGYILNESLVKLNFPSFNVSVATLRPVQLYQDHLVRESRRDFTNHYIRGLPTYTILYPRSENSNIRTMNSFVRISHYSMEFVT